MATRTPTRKQLGMAANTITLAHFTEQSVTDFLHAIANLVTTKVAPRGGDSPWFPSWSKDHPSAVMIPARDGGDPYVFNLLTHGLVTRCIVAADPANLIDQADAMHSVADSKDDYLRLLNLRIAARWNYSMHLGQENLLKYEELAVDLPGDPTDQGVPDTVVERTRLVTDNGELLIVDDEGNTTTAGRFNTETDSTTIPTLTHL